MKITRRTFITQAGVVAVGFGVGSSPFVLRAAEGAATGNSVVVFVLLRGGVDGMAICASYGDAEYYKVRPSIALPKPRTAGADSLIDLDGYFGLHPAFAPLERVFRDGQLAIVHAAGSRAMSRSHFDAQEFLETGTPGVRTPNGWMERCLERIPGSDVTQGVSFTPLRPRAFLGAEPVFVTENLSHFDLAADGWKQEAEVLLREMYHGNAGGVIEAGRNAFGTLDVIRKSPANSAARSPKTARGEPTTAQEAPFCSWVAVYVAHEWQAGGRAWSRATFSRSATSTSRPTFATSSSRSPSSTSGCPIRRVSSPDTERSAMAASSHDLGSNDECE